MAKISGSLPNFANGVSQQAMALRLASQGELQVNGYSTIIEGLKKRPPTQRVRSLGSGFINNAIGHIINRDARERYEVMMTSSGIRVFDLSDGKEKKVKAPDGWSYLHYPSGYKRPPYRAVTVGDYTFIANTTKKVAMTSAIEPLSPSECLINVMAGNYGKDYKITINGAVVAWYRTPDGTSANQSPAVDTGYISRRLATGETVALLETVNEKPNGDWVWKTTDTSLSANGITAANGWTVKVHRSTIYIKKNNGAAFSVGIEDGYNGHAMKAIHKTVQDFSDLPAFGEEGMVMKVTGSVSTDFDDYYIRFGKQSPSDSAATPGVWREVPAPGTKKAFNPNTMPHVLVREADGTFTFKQAKWENRKAGDLDTVPEPSFVGQTISEVVFFKNRFGLLAGENVIMSRSGEYFDFWRATATTLLDDDPIDVAAAEDDVSVLRSAKGFSDRLVLFADQRQFTLMGGELLTPKTVSIRPSTSYTMSSKARPVSAGSSVFFPVDRGQFSMIREYKVNEQTGVAEAEDVTGHVPQYIPGSIMHMASSTHEDILLVQADGDPTSLYVYKYYWANEQKLQASWSKWTFPGVTRIFDFGFLSSQLYLILDRGGETFIEYMDVQPGGVDPNSTFVCNLDRRFKVSASKATYNAYDDLTTIPMDVDTTRDDYVAISAGGSSSKLMPGVIVEVVQKGVDYVVVRGDLRNTPLYFGTIYEMRYRLSTIFLRQESRGGGISAITEGRLQLLQLMLQYSKTAYFKVEVTTLAAPTRSYISNGRLMGDPENKVDQVVLRDGTFRLPILSKNDRVVIDLVNDSYLPCSLLGAEWVGNYIRRSQRI